MIHIAHNGLPNNILSELVKLENVTIDVDNPSVQPSILIMYDTTPEEIRIRTSLFGKYHTDIIVLDNNLSSLRRVSEFHDTGVALLFDSDAEPSVIIDGIVTVVSSNINNYCLYGNSSCERKLNDNVIFDEAARTIVVKGVRHNLNPKEYAIMQMLYENRNTGVDKKTILTALWGDTKTSASRSFDVYMNRLRHLFDNIMDITIKNDKRTNGTSGRRLILGPNKNNQLPK